MKNDALPVSNYCACFIDLLGQRQALIGQGLVPTFQTETEQNAFNQGVLSSVGAILELQKNAEHFLARDGKSFSLRHVFPDDKKHIYDEMQRVQAKYQRWSDGLVVYTSLATGEAQCPMNAVYQIMVLAGVLCFHHLSIGMPIRGAIETRAEKGRVALGDCSPRAPTDPYVRD